MTEITRSEIYEEMIQELIDTDQLLCVLKAMNAKVVCVISDNAKLDESKRRVYAEIEKIPPKYQSFIFADAMITLYMPNIASFSQKKKEIVLLRELLKLNIDDTENKRKVIIGDYEIKDFRCIIQRYGANWDQEASLFDEAVK